LHSKDIDLKNKCRMCFSKTQNGAIYCSDECAELHYDYIAIEIPRLWVKNRLATASCSERYKMIIDFSRRHNYNIDLVVARIERQYLLDVCKEKI